MVADDAILFNETNRLGAVLWAKTLGTEGLNNDPKMVSCVLYKRLWGHHRGYALLYNGGLVVESDTLLRSSIEAAICLCANFHTDGGLWIQLKQDALHTVTAQIKQAREIDDKELERDGEKARRWLAAQMEPGLGARKLEMKDLADDGGVPMLYQFYRGLSGTSSHVTGLSIMRGVVSPNEPAMQEAWADLTKRTHHLWQIAAMLQGSFCHALLLNDEELADTTLGLAKRLQLRLDVAGL
ncbi:MAG: DUF5677 domain-containing protein [Pseudomonadota bacterium]